MEFRCKDSSQKVRFLFVVGFAQKKMAEMNEPPPFNGLSVVTPAQ